MDFRKIFQLNILLSIIRAVSQGRLQKRLKTRIFPSNRFKLVELSLGIEFLYYILSKQQICSHIKSLSIQKYCVRKLCCKHRVQNSNSRKLWEKNYITHIKS